MYKQGVLNMKTHEYRLIDGEGKLEANKISNFEKQFKELKEKVNPKNHQCIAMNGYIILEGEFHQDGILLYKTPKKKVDYGIDNLPDHLKEELRKQQNELGLTKEHVNKIKRELNKVELKVMEIDKQMEFIKTTAYKLKENSNKEKQIKKFNSKYSSFNECLTSQLNTFDNETKNDFRKKLEAMIEVINDVMRSYL